MDGTRIMIIDGDATVSELLAGVLADEGYHVLRWESGINDATFLHTYTPQLILLDTWVRQRDDGITLLRQVWNDPALANMRVLVCMSDLNVAQRYAPLFEAHGCIIVPKPFDLDQVLAAVEQAVEDDATPRSMCSVSQA